MTQKQLLKWDLLSIWIPECRQPHFKYCICICPQRLWFLYINGEPPFGRKAKEVAVVVANYECTPLTQKESWIDTTTMQEMPKDGRVEKALADPKCQHGQISPSLKRRVLESVLSHRALTDEEQGTVLESENI